MATDVTTAATGSATWNSTTVDDVRNIQVTKTKEEKRYASGSTSGNYYRQAGNADASGSFTVYAPSSAAGPTGILGFDEGDTSTLVLKSTSGQTLFTGTAQILSIDFGANVENADLVEATVSWGQSTT